MRLNETSWAGRLLLLVLVAMLFSSCGREAELGGSVGENYDLSFDLVRARLYPTELAIEYVREDGEVAVRLTVRVTDTGLSGPATVDLGQFGGVSGSASGQQIPPFISGTLYLRAYEPVDDAEVVGDFEVLLEGTRTELTLTGNFETTLDVVG